MTPTVSFATYCYWKDIDRVSTPGFLQRLSNQHGHQFCEILLIKQNCNSVSSNQIDDVPNLKVVATEDHQNIYAEFNIEYPNQHSEIFYDGHNEPHWWPKHTQNLLVAGKIAIGDYILFCDNDITIERNQSPGWVSTAIDCLNKYKDALVVCPGEGSRGRSVPEGNYTNIMSQQIFLAKTSRFRSINFDIPFPYTRQTVPAKYTPAMPQYHYMLEGRIGRYLIDNNLKRLVLDSDKWRYWHHNPVDVNMFDKKPLK